MLQGQAFGAEEAMVKEELKIQEELETGWKNRNRHNLGLMGICMNTLRREIESCWKITVII